MQEPAPYPSDRPRASTIRSRLVLQVADHLIGEPDWPRKQAYVDLRVQGDPGTTIRLAGSDAPQSVLELAKGRLELALLNPASMARPVLLAAGWSDPLPVASVATIPSYDQLCLAVRADLGVRRLADLPLVKPPLRLSLRGQRDHGVQQMVEDVLASVDVSLADIEAWGGQVHHDPGLPHSPDRWSLLESGERDAVFDEGVYNWGEPALRAGFTFLRIDDEALVRLEERGYRRGVLTPHRFPSLTEAVLTLDFSGFMLCVRADAEDDLVRAVCAALVARRGQIPWQGGPALPLDRMVTDDLDAPLGLPLHPVAAAFWRDLPPAPAQ